MNSQGTAPAAPSSAAQQPLVAVPHTWPNASEWERLFEQLEPATSGVTGVPELSQRLATASPSARERVLAAAAELAAVMVPLGATVPDLQRAEARMEAWRPAYASPDELGHGVTGIAAVALLVTPVDTLWASWGITPQIRRDTRADMGRQLALHERVYGAPGCENFHWAALGLVLPMYVVGRLQWHLTAAPPSTATALMGAASAMNSIISDAPPAQTACVLSAHIPESGPLEPAAVHDSARDARTFFHELFPAHPVTHAYCYSWLLNPLLSSELPGTNLAKFCALWQPCGEPVAGTHDAVYFAFRVRPPYRVAELQVTSRMQALVARVAATESGWLLGAGTFELPIV